MYLVPMNYRGHQYLFVLFWKGRGRRRARVLQVGISIPTSNSGQLYDIESAYVNMFILSEICVQSCQRLT